MVTQTKFFTLFEPNLPSDEDYEPDYNGFALNVKQLSFHIIEKSEFCSPDLLNRSESFFVSEGNKTIDPKTVKGFNTKDEALAYAEKEFNKQLNQLIHDLQELQ